MNALYKFTHALQLNLNVSYQLSSLLYSYNTRRLRFVVGSIIRLLLEDKSDISLLLLASLSTASNSRKELSRAGGEIA